jgi:hypothetical protein
MILKLQYIMEQVRVSMYQQKKVPSRNEKFQNINDKCYQAMLVGLSPPGPLEPNRRNDGAGGSKVVISSSRG